MFTRSESRKKKLKGVCTNQVLLYNEKTGKGTTRETTSIYFLGEIPTQFTHSGTLGRRGGSSFRNF